MELDDLKVKWKSGDFAPPDVKPIDFHKMIESIEKSKKGIRGIFLIELCISILIYFGFLAVVFWGGDVKPFMYKLVVITLVAAVPMTYRLYKAQRMIRAIDYSRDIKSNLVDFMVYYKTTLNLYRWGSYGLLTLMLLIFFMDKSFTDLDFRLQLGIAGYIILVMLLIGPYIRKAYGSKIKSMEAFLSD